MFMSVPSFDGDGELDLGGAGAAWETHDWHGEVSARQRKRDAQARRASGGGGGGVAEEALGKSHAKAAVNRAKPARPEKKVKVDMRFGSAWDKKRLADARFDERREAKRAKYAALAEAAKGAEKDDGSADASAEDGAVSGKILGRRRRAAEKRHRAAEKRRAERLAKGLPVTQPVKPLPAKLAVGTAAGVAALELDARGVRGGGSSGGDTSSKNAKRKERREKQKRGVEAEEAKVKGAGKRAKEPNDASKGAASEEETAKERRRRETREAAEALERRAAELRAAAAMSSSEEEEDERSSSDDSSAEEDSEETEEEEEADAAGDWGEQFSSDDDESDGASDEESDGASDGASDEEPDEEPDSSSSSSSSDSLPPPAPAIGNPSKMSRKMSLVDKMRAKLSGGQFRALNESLYTTTGAAALEMVRSSPGTFGAYHQGFREQTKEWPSRPVDACLRWLATQPKSLSVADFGCGDAELAARAKQKTVHSFDLESDAPGVVACNMANVPLEDSSVEVAVFSLSLMGTDYGAFLEEAHRVRRRDFRRRLSPSFSRGEEDPKFTFSRTKKGARSLHAPPVPWTGSYYSRAPDRTDVNFPFHRRAISA